MYNAKRSCMMENIFRLKASPGRGKLSPQVTDEGAGKQQLCGELPLIRLLTAFAATFPQRVKAFVSGQVFKNTFHAGAHWIFEIHRVIIRCILTPKEEFF